MRTKPWFQPDVEEFVGRFRGDLASDFRSLFRGCKWWTVGEMCEMVRQSWLNKIAPQREGGIYHFDILPRRAQYAIVRRVVRDRAVWDYCLGSDDGREVLVYRLVAGNGTIR